jgi:PAS domain S-box-containing protein
MNGPSTHRREDAGELAGRLAAIMESSDDAIICATLNGTITSCNASASRMYGYPAGELAGHDLRDLYRPDRAGELGPSLDLLRRGQRIHRHQTKHVRKDGAILEVSVSASPVRNAGGAVAGVALVERDVTSHNRTEAALAALGARMTDSERMETVGQLTGGLAHDFNNLLGAIVGYVELAAGATADRPAVRADLEQIQAAAERASRLTRQLLIFSLRETGRPGMLDLGDVVAGIRELVTASVGSRVELRFALAAMKLPTVADRGDLEQVLLNLAVNARDATPPGGVVTISTGAADLSSAGAGRPADVPPGRYVELAVGDTGTGMTADVAARIFEPLFTTKAAAHGTGLGLSTVYQAVTRAGGAISVDTGEGAGATFHVYLPAADLPAAGPPPDGVRHLETVLVVDDEPAMLRSTVRILRNNGYYTLEAETGNDALSLASSHDFQLLLTDSVMPRMSGAELATLVRELKPGVPVVRMSGYQAQALGQSRAADEASILLEKPFTADVLLKTVRVALDSRHHDAAGKGANR